MDSFQHSGVTFAPCLLPRSLQSLPFIHHPRLRGHLGCWRLWLVVQTNALKSPAPQNVQWPGLGEGPYPNENPPGCLTGMAEPRSHGCLLWLAHFFSGLSRNLFILSASTFCLPLQFCLGLHSFLLQYWPGSNLVLLLCIFLVLDYSFISQSVSAVTRIIICSYTLIYALLI
jgi:hypothetical protein